MDFFKKYYSKHILEKVLRPTRFFKTKTKYLIIAKENKLNPAELDILIWKNYSKTEWEKFIF